MEPGSSSAAPLPTPLVLSLSKDESGAVGGAAIGDSSFDSLRSLRTNGFWIRLCAKLFRTLRALFDTPRSVTIGGSGALVGGSGAVICRLGVS